MKSWAKIASLALAVGGLAVACSTIETSADWDKAVDFSKYKTYAWHQTEQAENSLVRQRIEGAVDNALASKGLRKADSDPDLWVVTHTRLSEQTQINTYDTGWGYGWRWGYGGYGGGMSTTTVSKIPVGNLIVDLVDAKAKQMVWRGTASKTLDPKSAPEKREAAVNEAVQKMFEKYPAGGAK